MRTVHIAAAVAALLTTTSSAWAASGWDTGALGYSGNGLTSATPWIAAPTAGSSYAEWNAFNSLPTDSTPDIAGAGSVTEFSGTSFLTGGGNIYSFAAATEFTVTVGGGTGTWDVYLRVASLGTSPLEEALLNGVSATRVITFSGSASGGFGGLEEESLWHWTVTGTPTFAIDFGAAGSSLSLDQLAVYAVQQQAAVVPEPGTWAMVAAGLAGVGLMARRRKQAE